jgi:hypothetical protein
VTARGNRSGRACPESDVGAAPTAPRRPAARVGKSTLVKMLFGYLPCRGGRVSSRGRPIHRLDTTDRHRRKPASSAGLSA